MTAFYLVSLLMPAQPIESEIRKAVTIANQDAQQLSKLTDVQSIRYFWSYSTNDKFKVSFQFHLNLLSRYNRIIRPVEVTPNLWRVDIDELKWDRATLEAAQFVDIFFHIRKRYKEEQTVKVYWPGGFDTLKKKSFDKKMYAVKFPVGKDIPLSAPWLPTTEIINLRELLYTEVPILNAEWFLVQSARQLSLANQQTGIGYYDFLGLKNRNDFFKLLRFNQKDAEEIYKEIKAVQEFSKVSPHPRQIVRYNSTSGPVWVALDTNKPLDKGISLNNLDNFDHQIEEWYGFLYNGLPVTFLSDDKGNRQNNAPADAVGFHDNSPLNESRDGRIHVNLACIRCHAGSVLRPIDDYIRKIYKPPLALGDKDKQAYLKRQAQYFSNLEKWYKRDVADYQEAFTEATVTKEHPKGLTAQQAVEYYIKSYHNYADYPVTIEQAARELGVKQDIFLNKLNFFNKVIKGLDQRLAPFIADRPQPISRNTWEDVYPLAQQLLIGIPP